VKDAEANAEADRERKEKVEVKNQADTLVYQANKQVAEFADKVPAADKEKIEGLIKSLEEAIAADNTEQMKTLTPELQQALYAIGTSMYQQAGAEAPDGGAGPDADAGSGSSSGSEDDVIDAEFSESK
jgi:molecular chaperone DnaK